ncbi:MAG: hypothetical protein E6K58_04615 [Nitrospirae bacterium]|nr:MAG: hypothetical protein AUI03_03890 [Nitrospirae bacterium 13_2_20CM_2_62_8]TLY43701.1 MAG: hypothetical protein E6K58_04615 [Nitrospirota bacterium]
MIPRAAMGALTDWFLTWSVLLALGGSAVGVLTVVERQRPSLARAEELSYLPKGEYLKLAVLGYRQLAADLIWLKAVQHLGEKAQTHAGYLSAYHAVDVLTDVDPTFVAAYLVTGSVLGVWAGLPRESIALLTKGMRHHPDVWQLPFYVGYDYFYELGDPVMAARYFRMAAVLPGAPDYLPRLAARMTVEVGDPQAALEFLQRLYQQTEDEKVRQGLSRRMKEVIAERDIRFLEEGVRRYKARYGQRPVRLEDLVTRGIIPQIPGEPFGGSYELKVAEGTVTSTGLRERLRVHRK